MNLPDQNAIAFHSSIRKIIRKKLKNSFMVIYSADIMQRNKDVDFSFRQNSDFFYLTGLNTENCILVLSQEKETFFLQAQNKDLEVWTGVRIHTSNAAAISGIENIDNINNLEKELTNLFGNKSFVYLNLKQLNKNGLLEIISAVKNGSRKRGYLFKGILDLDILLHEERLMKKNYEINQVKKAISCTRKGFLDILSSKLDGVNESAVQNKIEYIFKNSGATDMAYPSIIAGGANAVALHYINNNNILELNTLLLIDAGAEYNYYASDVTRTFPVGVEFTKSQKEIYNIVLSAQKQACAEVKPGNNMVNIHQMVVNILTEGLLKLGILKGSFKENIKDRKYRKYFMHGTGHWLGLDVHDEGRYFNIKNNGRTESRYLQAGMLTTIEPGLYLSAADKNVPVKYRGIGIRIEDNVLVTKNGNEILTHNIPKEIEEIEKLRSLQHPL